MKDCTIHIWDHRDNIILRSLPDVTSRWYFVPSPSSLIFFSNKNEIKLMKIEEDNFEEIGLSKLDREEFFINELSLSSPDLTKNSSKEEIEVKKKITPYKYKEELSSLCYKKEWKLLYLGNYSGEVEALNISNLELCLSKKISKEVINEILFLENRKYNQLLIRSQKKIIRVSCHLDSLQSFDFSEKFSLCNDFFKLMPSLSTLCGNSEKNKIKKLGKVLEKEPNKKGVKKSFEYEKKETFEELFPTSYFMVLSRRGNLGKIKLSYTGMKQIWLKSQILKKLGFGPLFISSFLKYDCSN